MVKSARGKEINFEALALANGDQIALGNAKMNARGDIVGKGGKIVRTREEVANEYNTKLKTKAENVAVSQDIIGKIAEKEAKTTNNASSKKRS